MPTTTQPARSGPLCAAQGIVSSSKKPLTASIGTGAGVAALGLLYALWTLVVFFVDGELPSGYTSLAIILSTLGGIQLIFLGVIGLYIGALFDEAKQRPHYIVDEVIGSCTRSQAHVTTRQP